MQTKLKPETSDAEPSQYNLVTSLRKTEKLSPDYGFLVRCFESDL